MNKTELIRQVAEKTGLPKKDVRLAVNTVFEVITESLKSHEKVQLVGFGHFEVRQRAGRKGRNPRTGEEIFIKPGQSPAFRPGKHLKTAVND